MPPRKLSNNRAVRIIAVAREEFAQRGFDGARVAHIARVAAVNKQLLFYYYRSKRGLFQAVLGQAAAELETAVAALPVAGGRPLGRPRARLPAQAHLPARPPDPAATPAPGHPADLA